MAKQVEDIVVRLVGEGFEALDKIKGSFRELGKVTNLAERDILAARDSLSEFAKAAGNTEAVNKGLIDAFKGLRSQVDINSAAYRSFSTDVARLETELRGSTAAIDRQRTSLLSNAAAGKENVASLQRQVSALRQLQQETRPGSSAFLQLGKDIDTVTIKLGKLKSEAQAFNLALGQQAGATPEVLNRQIATLQKGLQAVRFDAEQFVETLRKIQLLQITQTGRTGRAGVTADFEAYRSREFTAGYADPSRLAAMPDTTAALNQELSELTKRLDNVSRGGTDYVAVSLRIADIQRQLRTELVGTAEAFRQLDIAQTGAERRAGKLADIQEYYRTQGPTAPGVGGFRDPQTGAMIAAGSRLQTGIRPGTQYDRPIGPQPVNPAFAAFESNIKQSQERITSIYDDAYVRRTQLQADYNQISIDKLLTGLDMEGQVRNAAFGRELAVFDKQLEARDRRRGRRLTGSQLAQGAGAALSGGIFGGPEGLIGGLGGLAVGGVGGAFAGAAIGAQAGMFRQQLGGTADYAASIGKLQIALRGVVGSQAAYDAAIRAAAAATRDLNIPQEEATRGLTRLSAAVIGAGGTVADSSFAFRAMSEAIKATGGNAEQVDGALLALTQVFSKGKVSAEELNQIAERLPGTFTLFAQAAGKTGPELQKALEQGQVGLNDLMKFLALTSKRYGTTALTIAASSQDAGARLTVAFQAMRLEVGKALQPLGAELQGAFAAFIKDITPAVVGSAKALAAAISFFTDNKAAAGLATFALQAGAVALAIKGLQAASAGLIALNLASWFTGAASGATQLQLPIAGATTKVGIFKAAVTGLGTALKALLPLTLITITVDVIVKGIAKLIAAREELKKLRNERDSVPGEGEGIGPKLVLNAQRRYTGASREKIIRDQQEQQKFVAGLRKQLQDLEATQSGLGTAYGQTAIGGIANIGRGFEQENTKAAIELLKEKITRSEEVLNLNVRTFKTEAEIEKARQAALSKKFADPTGGEDAKDKATEKARKDAEAVAAEQQRQNEATAKAKIALDDAVFRNGMELIRKKYEYEQELEGKKRDLFVKSQTGAARETAGLISGFLGELQTLTNRLTAAGEVVQGATQDLKSAKAMAATTISPTGAVSAAGRYMQGGIGPKGPNQYGPHFDIKRSDGGFYSRTALDPYVQVNGRPLSSGVTVPGGEYGAPRSYGGHAGWDYAFGGSAAMTLTGGAKWMGNQKGDYGDATAFMTPDGKVYKVIHGKFEGSAPGRQPPGVAAAINRDIAAEGAVATTAANLDKAKTAQLLEAQTVKELTALAGKSYVLDFTDALRQQNAALEDTASITELRNRLQLAGERPETIDAEIRKAEAIQRSTQQTDLAAKALKALDDAGLGGSVAATSLRDGIAAQNAEIAKFKELTDAATAAQIAFNEAMRLRQDDRIGLGMQEGARAYVESVGTMRDATAQLTQTGIKGVEDALFSLVTTGTANFREFAAEILKQSARMILQLTIQRVIMQIIGAISGGGASANPSAAGGDWMGAVGRMNPTSAYAMGGTFAANNIVPYAMGGAFTNSIVTKPTLFKFANGGTTRTGLMGEAGPEAIMPLKRGADGRLGVSGGGSAPVNVTVNVDASGNGQVAGDQNQGAQLGRVIAGAVQQELIKQRRPGGLLA